jgi:hypothetical protein
MIQKGSGFTRKYQIRLESLSRDKQASSDEEKKSFITLTAGHRVEFVPMSSLV